MTGKVSGFARQVEFKTPLIYQLTEVEQSKYNK